ncbi:U3 small nucleolar ribonucleoprotein protein IMP3 [Talaromyces islandicus]|uniref:U3 small nucleolar ribonucleoprotein protein IMP3 n=1 Tax=Talaromyces islandicus TaxID=28573 RepID=A0A0U1M4M6_TALIS|nr:U3 small nucleolar ribonucleoprotein protein IMP3 [Talaromyces islandicus]
MADEQLEFPIQPNIAAGLRMFLYSQLFVTPHFPRHSFKDQIVIVTGSNVGLGLEAARQFYRLNCTRLVLAVRTTANGQLAKEDNVKSVKHRADADTIEIWPLDLSSTASTLAFTERVKTELRRIDILVENAGINSKFWTLSEGFEQAVQVNVLNTFLLALSLLPKLNKDEDIVSRLAAASGHLHDEGEPYRYQVTKLIEVLLTREIVSRLASRGAPSPPVLINIVNPGLCKSTLDRSGSQPSLGFRILRAILDRKTEVGSQTLVLAACAPEASHGEFQSDGTNQGIESWIYTDIGRKVQKKVLLRKVNFHTYKSDNNHREQSIRARYYLQGTLDYQKYNTLCGNLRSLAHKLSALDPDDPFRKKTESEILEKLWAMGILKQSREQGAGLSAVEHDVTVSAFCRRRVGVLMTRNGMVPDVKTAVTLIEQGHVRVGTEVVTDPAFLVTRSMEDFVTWVDSSKIKRSIMKYRDNLDDFDLMV